MLSSQPSLQSLHELTASNTAFFLHCAKSRQQRLEENWEFQLTP